MMLGHALHWREPLWLLLALYPLLMLATTQVVSRWQREHYADTALLPWALSRHTKQRRYLRWRQLAHFIAWGCFAMAMAGPRFAEKIYLHDHRHDAEVMMVIDLSQSMSARDLLPNRLQRARLELLDFLQTNNPLRIGITVFAARPHLLSPLTYDKSVIRHYLTALKPALLPTAGSNINAALLFAATQFTQTPATSRRLLLISDGDSAGLIPPAVLQHTAQQFRQQGIRIYALGVGTPAGQAVVAHLGSETRHVQTAVTTLQRSTLQQYARLTNGGYADISSDNSDWQQLYDQGMAAVDDTTSKQQASGQKIIWQDVYSFPLVFGLIFFIASLLNIDRSKSNKKVIAPLILILSLGFIIDTYHPVEASTNTYAQAYQLYQQGKYKQAHQLFAQLSGYLARLGEASSLYQQKDYATARDVYIQAVLVAADDRQRATALFNLANSYYQLREFLQAQQLYTDVLRYQAQFPAANINRLHAQQQQRLKEAKQALTYRPGNGPRNARAADKLDVSNSRVSMGHSTPNKQSALPAVKTDAVSSLPLLEQTELASQQVENDADTDWTYRLNTLSAVRSRQLSLHAETSDVWQRLFEQEEGFPAPVLHPHVLPGVSPW